MNCNVCGGSLKNSWNFCPRCGKRLIPFDRLVVVEKKHG